ncbi:MAG TPA: hypothetical protein PKE47_16140, partial [Verrucomicrobiota bacterium]|nr:hypothetical protein [Verrucomicrobiota bacterium]
TDALRVATIAEFHGGAEVIAPAGDDPAKRVSIPAGLRLLGEQAAQGAPLLTMKGTYRVGRLLEWGNTHVQLNGMIRPALVSDPEAAPGAGPVPLPFTLSLRGAAAEGEPLAWTGEGRLELQPVPGDAGGAGIVREDERVRHLGAEIRLAGVGVDNSHGEGTELRFTGVVAVSGAAVEFQGPCVFEDFARLTATDVGRLSFEPSARGRGPELRGKTILEMDVPPGRRAEVVAAALTFRDTAAFELRDILGGGQVVLTVSTNRRVAPDAGSTVRGVPLAIRGGHLLGGNLLRVVVGPGADLELGGDAGPGAVPAVVSISADVDVAGTVRFLPQPDGSGTVVTGSGDWRILPGGSARLEPGCGLEQEFGAIVNLGDVLIASPPAAAVPVPSPLGTMFINDGGRLHVQAGGWLKLSGADFLDGELLLDDDVRVEVLQGRQSLFDYAVPLADGTEQPRSVSGNGLVNLRAALRTETGAGVRMLLSAGSLVPDFPGGLGLEQPLALDHLVMGRAESALGPRVALLDPITGTGLTVKKTLAWHGGQFRGVAGKNHEVLLPAGSATDIRAAGDDLN